MTARAIPAFLLFASAVCSAAELDDHLRDLKAKSPKTRTAAAQAIGAMGREAEEAAKPLCDSLLDPSPAVVAASLRAIEKVRPDLYKPAVGIVVDGKPDAVRKAAQDLAKMGDRAAPASLLMATRFAQYHAQFFQRGFGSEDQPAVSALGDAINVLPPTDPPTTAKMKLLAGAANKVGELRGPALRYMVRWAGKDADRRKEVFALLKQNIADPGTFQVVAPYIEGYGLDADEFAPAIERFRLSESRVIRETAVRVLSKISPP